MVGKGEGYVAVDDGDMERARAGEGRREEGIVIL